MRHKGHYNLVNSFSAVNLHQSFEDSLDNLDLDFDEIIEQGDLIRREREQKKEDKQIDR